VPSEQRKQTDSEIEMKQPVCLSLLITAGLHAASVQQSQDAFLLEDGGRQRQFVVAADQNASIDSNGKTRIRSGAADSGLNAVAAQAFSRTAPTGEEPTIVLYEKGAVRNAFTRRIVTKGIVVEVRPGTDVVALAAAVGAEYGAPAPAAANTHILRAGKAVDCLKITEALRGQTGVVSANPLLARRANKRWVPNDQYFSSQWHLRNTGQNGGLARMDVNVINTWNTYKGAGVRIGIVDDGLECYHPDLFPNVDFQYNYDWNGGDTDPSPEQSEWEGELYWDAHGTACAGVAAARGGNGFGVSGVAPFARLVGMRLTAGEYTDLMQAEAFTHRQDVIQIKSNSWGPVDDGVTLEAPGPLAAAALKNAATTGRGGKGTIFVWAGGNGRREQDNSNYDGYVNSIYTIGVAAMNDLGSASRYSEPGASLVVTAPSDNQVGGPDDQPFRQGIATTDLVGQPGLNAEGYAGDLAPDWGYPANYDFPNASYTRIMGGTSSAAPLVAGVVALMLEANPNLGWRDVQEILMKSATKNSPSDSDWIRNGAGQQFNHNFGAGLVNAGAAVNFAKTWRNLGPQTSVTVNRPRLNLAIPDSNATGVNPVFSVSAPLRVEHVTVTVDIRHTNRGQLEVLLTSPSGTVSRLAEKHGDDGDDYDWTFMTVRNWGENARGTWRLSVRDRESGAVGVIHSAQLTIFGSGGAITTQSIVQ
jgi:subtilisin-like proprotein convertase family protein